MPTRPAPHDYAAEAEALAHWFDFSEADIAASAAGCAAAAGQMRSRRVAWFVPHVGSAFAGGIYTALRIADHLRTRGIAQVLCVVGAQGGEADARAQLAQAWPDLAAACEIVLLRHVGEAPPPLGPLDAAIATLWMTTLPALKLRHVRRKLYLMQDWEPEFYPAGSVSALVEATCRFGFHAVCGGPAVAQAYRELGGAAEHFSYAVDLERFHARRPARAGALRVFCYGRPSNPRNCFELAAAALRDVKAALGERVEIVAAGAEWEPADHGLAGVVRNLGMLELEGLGDLYRSCDAALCLSSSRVPSLVLLELMACGTPVVTTRSRHAAWMFEGSSGAVIESEPGRSALAGSLLRLLSDDALRRSQAACARALAEARFGDWGDACRAVERAVG